MSIFNVQICKRLNRFFTIMFEMINIFVEIFYIFLQNYFIYNIFHKARLFA